MLPVVPVGSVVRKFPAEPLVGLGLHDRFPDHLLVLTRNGVLCVGGVAAPSEHVYTAAVLVTLQGQLLVLAGTSQGLLVVLNSAMEVVVSHDFHDSPVRQVVARAAGRDHSEDVLVLFEGGVVARVDGFTLTAAVRSAELDREAGRLGIKGQLWALGFDARAVACAGLEPRGIFSAPNSSLFRVVACGADPFLAAYAALEEDHSHASAAAIAGKLTTAVFSWGRSLLSSVVAPQQPKPEQQQKKKRDPPKALHALIALRDGAREGEALVVDPEGRVALCSDSLGRVLAIDLVDCVVLKAWKGYRDAECAWLASQRRLYAAIHLPRRGLLEVWDMARGGARLAGFNVGMGFRLQPLSPSLGAGTGFTGELGALLANLSTGALYLLSAARMLAAGAGEIVAVGGGGGGGGGGGAVAAAGPSPGLKASRLGSKLGAKKIGGTRIGGAADTATTTATAESTTTTTATATGANAALIFGAGLSAEALVAAALAPLSSEELEAAERSVSAALRSPMSLFEACDGSCYAVAFAIAQSFEERVGDVPSRLLEEAESVIHALQAGLGLYLDILQGLRSLLPGAAPPATPLVLANPGSFSAVVGASFLPAGAPGPRRGPDEPLGLFLFQALLLDAGPDSASKLSALVRGWSRKAGADASRDLFLAFARGCDVNALMRLPSAASPVTAWLAAEGPSLLGDPLLGYIKASPTDSAAPVFLGMARCAFGDGQTWAVAERHLACAASLAAAVGRPLSIAELSTAEGAAVRLLARAQLSMPAERAAAIGSADMSALSDREAALAQALTALRPVAGEEDLTAVRAAMLVSDAGAALAEDSPERLVAALTRLAGEPLAGVERAGMIAGLWELVCAPLLSKLLPAIDKVGKALKDRVCKKETGCSPATVLAALDGAISLMMMMMMMTTAEGKRGELPPASPAAPLPWLCDSALAPECVKLRADGARKFLPFGASPRMACGVLILARALGTAGEARLGQARFSLAFPGSGVGEAAHRVELGVAAAPHVPVALVGPVAEMLELGPEGSDMVIITAVRHALAKQDDEDALGLLELAKDQRAAAPVLVAEAKRRTCAVEAGLRADPSLGQLLAFFPPDLLRWAAAGLDPSSANSASSIPPVLGDIKVLTAKSASLLPKDHPDQPHLRSLTTALTNLIEQF
jgi:hypothetical protein